MRAPSVEQRIIDLAKKPTLICRKIIEAFANAITTNDDANHAVTRDGNAHATCLECELGRTASSRKWMQRNDYLAFEPLKSIARFHMNALQRPTQHFTERRDLLTV